MGKRSILLAFCAVVALVVQGAPAEASPHSGPPICSSAGAAISGHYDSLTIAGNAYVRNGARLDVSGDLTIATGSCLDAFTLGTVTVGGNLLVGRGATLALGCTPNAIGPVGPCHTTTTHDRVGGNIVADHAWTMYLDGDTVEGNVVSIGGGPGATFNPYVNFPIKDNTINGNLVVRGWKGAWFGALRNHVRGNVVISGNVGVARGGGGTPDSTEIATNHIAGNLICNGNTPAAQIGDSGGTPNVVRGHELGECKGL